MRLEMQFLHLWKTTVMGVLGKGIPSTLSEFKASWMTGRNRSSFF